MDVKGDLSGIAMPGEEKPFITERHSKIGLPFSPKGFPVELMSLSQQDGVRLRATVSEFGPVLLSRILDLNDIQESVLAVIFKYCDNNQSSFQHSCFHSLRRYTARRSTEREIEAK